MHKSRAEVVADLIKKKSASMKLDLKVVIVRQFNEGEIDFEVTASFGGSVSLDRLHNLSRGGESVTLSVTPEHHLLLRIV